LGLGLGVKVQSPTHTSLLVRRKIREDYINPLVTDEVLQRAGNGIIRFNGLPSGVGQEINEKQMKEEWEEENIKRKELGKPEVPFEEWIKIRPERFKPLRGGP
jgi:hypothetical protein